MNPTFVIFGHFFLLLSYCIIKTNTWQDFLGKFYKEMPLAFFFSSKTNFWSMKKHGPWQNFWEKNVDGHILIIFWPTIKSKVCFRIVRTSAFMISNNISGLGPFSGLKMPKKGRCFINFCQVWNFSNTDYDICLYSYY